MSDPAFEVASFSPKPGQPIRADDIRKLIAVANRLMALRGDSLSSGLPALTVMAANVGSASLAPYAVGVIRDQALADPERQSEVVVQVAQAEEGDGTHRIAVCLDQIPVGQVGRVALVGVAWAATDGSTGNYGSVSAGQAVLTLGDSTGPCEVLATSGNYALIRFPTSTGGDGDGDQWRFLPDGE